MRQVRQAPRSYVSTQAPQHPGVVPVPQFDRGQTTAPTAPPHVTIENIYEAAGYWHGGKAHQVDKNPCPRCGSNQFYSRAHGIKRGPPPAPHCYNCGYNDGMFDQGLASTWGA